MSTAQQPASTAVTATTKRDKVDNFRSSISRFEPTLASVLSSHVTPERVIALTLTAATKNPALFDCTIESVALALIQVAQWDLEIGRTAHLVPFGKTCTAIADWKGLVELMLRTGHVRDVKARPVYEKEVFNVQEGLAPSLEHFPIYNAEQRGELIAFYAVAFLARKGGTFEVMTKPEVEAIRNRAASRNSDAWKNHFVEMGKKTVIRRLAKRMPQTAALQSALSTEDRLDAGDLIAAIQREERHVAQPTFRQKQLPVAVKADAPYEFDDAAPTNAAEPVRVTPAPRSDAVRHAAATAAGVGDPYADDDEQGNQGDTEANIRPEPTAESSGNTRREATASPASSARHSTTSGSGAFKLPFNIGLAKIKTPLAEISTLDLEKALKFATDVGKYSELVEAISLVLDDRRHGDAQEPTQTTGDGQ